MRFRQSPTTFYVLFIFLLAPLQVKASEPSALHLQTRYASIFYTSEKQLQRLNRELILGRRLSYLLDDKKFFTVQDEVAGKIDLLVDRVQVVLEMFPQSKIAFDIEVYSTAKDAQKELFNRYGKKVNFISFYSRRDNLLYLSAKNAQLRVVAHELGHVVIEHYFNRSPPSKIHEVMAQYAEKHIID